MKIDKFEVNWWPSSYWIVARIEIPFFLLVLRCKTSVIILSFLCQHNENLFKSGVYPYSNDRNSLKSSAKVNAIWIKCSQSIPCFRKRNVINLSFLCYNSDNFGFVMCVYRIKHHSQIWSSYVKFLLIYEDFYPREKKPVWFLYPFLVIEFKWW